MAEQEKQKKKKDRAGATLYYFYLICLAAAVVAFARVIYIQWFWKPDPVIAKHFVPKPTKDIIEPMRGAIISRDGRLLALSTPMYQLYMDCTVRKNEFAKKKNGTELEKEWLDSTRVLAAAIANEMNDLSAEQYYSKITAGRKNGNKYLKIGKLIDRETLLRLREKTPMRQGSNRSGVIVKTVDVRQYPYGELARRTIGYVKDNSNSNGNGHIGLEGKYDYALHGQEGLIWLKTTDNRRRIMNRDSAYVKPIDGSDIRTTLDITLQDITDKTLREHIQDDKSIEMACAILMDVKTGAIRSMVNLMRDTTDWSLRETYNMAIGLSSDPGSVFKATTLTTAIEDGYIKSLDETIPTNNGIIPGYPQDSHVTGIKEISYLHGFEISSNYVFRYIAVNNYDDNPKKFLDKLYLYKLGQTFDFDLDGLQAPNIPDPNSGAWSRTALGSIAMGYSISETPLHILTFYNALANKGKMMKPYLVESIEKDGKVQTKKGPSVLQASICSKATADTMLRALKAVTSDGTARRLKGAKLRVAGKTGTSFQVLSPEEIKKYGQGKPYYNTRDGSSHRLATFVGFFPADDPKYSAIICLKTYLVRGGVQGGGIPAAAMRDIVDQIYALEPEWGEELKRTGSVPGTAAKADSKAKTDGKTDSQAKADVKTDSNTKK